MSSEDISMVIQVLAGVNSTDSTIRNQAANKLAELRKNLGALSFCLLQISSLPTTESTIKITALVILRKVLDLESHETWKTIEPNLKEQIKNKSLEVFINEKDANQKAKICDVLTQIIEKVNDCEESWDDLKKVALSMLTVPINADNIIQIESLHKLLKDSTGYLYDNLMEQMKPILAYLEQIYNSNLLRLKVSSSEFISELISYGSKQEISLVKPFVFHILKTTLECLEGSQEDYLKRQLELLVELVSVEPDLWKSHFDDIFTLTQKIVSKKDYDDEKIRELGFEVLITLIDEISSLIEKKPEKIKILFGMIYEYALEIDNEVDASWATPTGYNYEDLESFPEEKLQFSQSLIDRVIEDIGIEQSFPILTEIINGLVMKDDWRFKYVGLYSLSNLSAFEEEMSSFEMTFNMIFSLTKNGNEKIRFAAINTINKFCDNFNPNFQKTYIETVIPLLMELYQKENILRIQCEIVETITSFIQFTTCEKILPYATKLFDLLFGSFIQNVPHILTKSILDCILEIGSTIEDECKPFAAKSFDIILQYFSKNYEQKVNRPLYGVLIENLATIGPYTKENYLPVVPKLVTCIIDLVSGTGAEKDPIRADLKNSIERLIPILQENFKDLLPTLIKGVLTLLAVRPQMSISSSPETNIDFNEVLQEDGKKKKGINDIRTDEIEDLSETLSLVRTLVEALENEFAPYIDAVEKEIIPLLKYEYSPKIRNKVAKIFPPIIETIQNHDQKVARGKNYISLILGAIEKETENSIRTKLFIYLYDLLNNCGQILTKPEVNQLFEKILYFFDLVEKERLDLNAKGQKCKLPRSQDDDEDDEDIGDFVKEDLEEIENTQTQISDTIGMLFKTHKELSGDIIQVIITKILPKYVSSSSSSFEAKMALYIADDMIEFLGMDVLANIWNDIFKLITSLALSKDDTIRQAAVYGIGIFAKFTTKDFDNYAPKLIEALQEAEKFKPNSEEDEETWNLAHDNIIGAYGRILFHQHESQIVKQNQADLIERWISNLPIKYDTNEQEQQHEWLADMALLKPELIPEKCVEHTFKSLAKIYNSKSSTDAINDKIKKVFTNAKVNPKLQVLIDKIYQSSEKKVKTKIEQLIK